MRRSARKRTLATWRISANSSSIAMNAFSYSYHFPIIMYALCLLFLKKIIIKKYVYIYIYIHIHTVQSHCLLILNIFYKKIAITFIISFTTCYIYFIISYQLLHQLFNVPQYYNSIPFLLKIGDDNQSCIKLEMVLIKQCCWWAKYLSLEASWL